MVDRHRSLRAMKRLNIRSPGLGHDCMADSSACLFCVAGSDLLQTALINQMLQSLYTMDYPGSPFVSLQRVTWSTNRMTTWWSQ
jgi:hypothetical protein